MDYKIIEDEVYLFCEDFFEDVAILSDDNEAFIEDNGLYIPKENYTILVDFLQKTFKNFKILDPTFYSITLDKLSNDLMQTTQIYNEVIQSAQNIKEIFESEFLRDSPTLTTLAKAILEFSQLEDKTEDELEYLKQIKKDYLKLKEIFFNIFEEIFSDDKKHYLNTIKSGINTKSYYFDKLLWQEANLSPAIVKHFSTRKLTKKLNTKDYILFTTTLMRPYTDEYKYLQNCLKVFK